MRSGLFPALLIEGNLVPATVLLHLRANSEIKVRAEKETAYDLSESSRRIAFLTPRHAHPITYYQAILEASKTATHVDFP